MKLEGTLLEKRRGIRREGEGKESHGMMKAHCVHVHICQNETNQYSVQLICTNKNEKNKMLR